MSSGFASADDVIHHAIELLLADLRTLGCVGIERIAQLLLAGACEHSINELIVNLVLHEEPRSRGAALAFKPEQAQKPAPNCGIKIGIGENDIRALAAEFQ